MAMKNEFMYRQMMQQQQNNCLLVDFKEEEDDDVMLSVDSADSDHLHIRNDHLSATNNIQTTSPKKKAGRPPAQNNDNFRSWSDEETHTLIESWSIHENLYNTKHRSYYNRDLRQRSLDDIENSLHASGIVDFNTKQIAKKLTDLKNYYGGQKRKIEASVSSGVVGDDAYISHWKFFGSLYFLNDAFTPRITKSASVEGEEVYDSRFEGSMAVSSKFRDGHEGSKSSSSKTVTKMTVTQHDEMMTSAATAHAPRSVIVPTKTAEEDDADDMFGKLLVSQIKLIPECDLKDDLKITLQQMTLRCKRLVVHSAHAPRSVHSARRTAESHVPHQDRFSPQPGPSMTSALSSPNDSISSYSGY